MITKICTLCKIEKNISEFSKKTSCKDGFSPWCKVCKSEKDKIYNNTEKARLKKFNRQNEIEWRNESNKKRRDYNKKHPEYKLLSHAKERAKNKNIEFSITRNDIIIPEYCPILGLKLEIGNGKFTDNSPTIDRIDNSKGYIKENIKIISWRANSIKGDSTIDEITKIIDYIKKYTH